MMRKIHAYHVIPSVPEGLKKLQELAYNLRWSWDHETIALFRRLDRDLWETAYHNPVLMLGTIDQKIRKTYALHEAAFRELLEYWKDSNVEHVSSGTLAFQRAVVLTNECVAEMGQKLQLAKSRRSAPPGTTPTGSPR